MHLVPKPFSPAQVLALSLAALIAAGTLLNWVPAAGARDGAGGAEHQHRGRRPAPTLFLIMILMFIGGAPGGATGGVKVTTFAITVAALWATMRGAEEPVIFKRRIPAELVARAFFICLISFLSVNVVAAILRGSGTLKARFSSGSGREQ